MEKQTEEFIAHLEEINQKKWAEIHKALKNVTDIRSIVFSVYPSKELLTKFKLNEDIQFLVTAGNGEGEMEYYYKGVKIDPECYYIRPDNYSEVSLLEILHECIAQNTHSPDIKKLEVKI